MSSVIGITVGTPLNPKKLISQKKWNALMSLLPAITTVSGVFTFDANNCLGLNDGGFADVPFTSNGQSFSNITVRKYSDELGYECVECYYDDKRVINGNGPSGFEFVNGYETIDFGTEPQEIFENELSWLEANTVKPVYISGVWKFNDTISAPINQTVKFTSNGTEYQLIDFQYSSEWGGYDGYYDTNQVFAASVTTWVTDGYRTIDFGTAPQLVSAGFFAWLEANAIQAVEVSGVWVLSNPPASSIPGDSTHNVSFTSGGTSYSSIRFESGENVYFDSTLAVMQGGSMLGDFTLDFGTTPQAVSAELYIWLEANKYTESEW